MRALYPINDPRPFRHAAAEDLFALAMLADRRIRSAIAHELDARAARRIVGGPTSVSNEVIDLIAQRQRMLRQPRPFHWRD